MIADSYLDARARLEASMERIRAARRMIGQVEQALIKDPTRVRFRNYAGTQSATEESNGFVFDATVWPTVDAMVELLNDYHTARSEALALWDALTPEKKRGVKSPADLLDAR
jgi:xanthine dehydrogenase molybdopterin-binding subunit B